VKIHSNIHFFTVNSKLIQKIISLDFGSLWLQIYFRGSCKECAEACKKCATICSELARA
jgi:hypothetical protein